MADWIIVADEEESGRKELSEILTNAGMEVTAVESGKVLVEYVRQNGFPDAILLDVRVPESEGFETVRLLKKEMSHGGEVPVILLTPEEDRNAEQKALEAGAMDYIHTPVSPDLLVSRIRTPVRPVRKPDTPTPTQVLARILHNISQKGKK